MAFAVDARALIPRPETEVLVDLALGAIGERLARAPRPPGTPPLAVADVGTGSGAIAVALAVALRRRGMLGEVEIVASDASDEAADLARENAVAQAVGDRVAVIDGRPAAARRDGRRACCVVPARFDVVCANLPYIPSAIVPGLPVAASFEPRDGARRGPGRARRHPAPARAAARSGWQRPAWRSWRSATSRARRSALPPPSGLPGWGVRVEPDLAGRPRVAVIERARPGPRPPGPAGVSGRRIRLVALDLDGTLIGDDLRLPPRTVAAIRAVVARGRPRRPRHRPHDAAPPSPTPASSGCARRSSASRARSSGRCPRPGSARLGRLLLHRPLPAEVARDAMAWCRATGLDAAREPPRADGGPGRRRARGGLLALELRAGRPRARPRRVDPRAGHEDHLGGPAAGRRPRSWSAPGPTSPAGPTPPSATRCSSSSWRRASTRVAPSGSWPGGWGWTCATRSRSATSATTSR